MAQLEPGERAARVGVGVRRALPARYGRNVRPSAPGSQRRRLPDQRRRSRRRARPRRAARAASPPRRASRPSRASRRAPRGRTRGRAPAASAANAGSAANTTPAGAERDRAAARAGRRRRRARRPPGRPPRPRPAMPSGVAPGDLGRLEQPAAATRGRSPARRAPRRSSAAARRRAAACPTRRRRRSPARRSQLQPHVVLGQHHVRDPRVGVRLVAAQPQQLRRGEAGQRAVAGQRDQPRRARRAPRSPRTRPPCAVVPQDRGADHRVGGVERDEAVHLPAEPDARRPRRASAGERLLGRRATSRRGPARPSPAAGWRAGRRPRARSSTAPSSRDREALTAEVPTSMPIAVREGF